MYTKIHSQANKQTTINDKIVIPGDILRVCQSGENILMIQLTDMSRYRFDATTLKLTDVTEDISVINGLISDGIMEIICGPEPGTYFVLDEFCGIFYAKDGKVDEIAVLNDGDVVDYRMEVINGMLFVVVYLGIVEEGDDLEAKPAVVRADYCIIDTKTLKVEFIDHSLHEVIESHGHIIAICDYGKSVQMIYQDYQVNYNKSTGDIEAKYFETELYLPVSFGSENKIIFKTKDYECSRAIDCIEYGEVGIVDYIMKTIDGRVYAAMVLHYEAMWVAVLYCKDLGKLTVWDLAECVNNGIVTEMVMDIHIMGRDELMVNAVARVLEGNDDRVEELGYIHCTGNGLTTIMDDYILRFYGGMNLITIWTYKPRTKDYCDVEFVFE